MAVVVLKGSDVAAGMEAALKAEVARLKLEKIEPKLGIIRAGARPDDIAYERGALKRFEKLGITVQVFEFSDSIDQDSFLSEVRKINTSDDIHGILLFRPLPGHLDEKAVIRLVDPHKDVDGMNPVNASRIFSGDDDGFAPCTPAAVMEMLNYAGVDLSGKNVAVVGRSMVVGRPLAMLMLKRNATVTICHTKTRDMEGICRAADVIIAAAGKARILTSSYVSAKSIVIDVGINQDSDGKLCGDVDYDSVSPLVSMISPVPGGAGTVTTSVLAKHVLKAAALKIK